jgi:hypothetical protein
MKDEALGRREEGGDPKARIAGGIIWPTASQPWGKNDVETFLKPRRGGIL